MKFETDAALTFFETSTRNAPQLAS